MKKREWKKRYKKNGAEMNDNLEKDLDTSPDGTTVENTSESNCDHVDDNTAECKAADTESAKKIAELEKSLSNEKDKYIRLAAEYDNFRKRSINDKMNAVVDATSKTIIEILSVIDNFERALSAECTDANYKKGVEMIFNQYKEVLNKVGVTEIEALGKTFDPNIHNAVNQVSDENFGENTVCQVFQKGYKLGEKVIRCSMVVVANP